MSLFTRWRGRSILTFAVLFVTLSGAAVYAQEAELPGVAVYVSGDIPNNEKKVLGAYLLNAIIKAGQGKNADGAEAFLAAVAADEQAKGAALSTARVCELSKQFNIRFICAASVTHAFEFFVISANIIDAEMETILFKGEAQSPLKSINDITQASNQIVESMFGINISGAQPAAGPMPAQNAEYATGAPPPPVYVAGDAKLVVDRVVAAVNAFKDATTKSIDAANAVKTAAQSKNFFAIKDAKKKVEDAMEAVKRAKADVTAAIDALNSAGPEAQAAVRAMGIDLSMFGGKGGGAEGGYDGSSGIENFTTGERVVTVVLNNVVPGLGSGVIMHDMFGLGTQIALYALGVGLISSSSGAHGDSKAEKNFVTVGVGALAANLTYNIIRSATYRKPGSIKPQRSPSDASSVPGRRLDYYLSPKYQLPMGTPVSWGGVNIETGLIWGEGGFFGLDIDFGLSYDKKYESGDWFSDDIGILAGGGLSLGNAHDLGNNFQFAYGMSAGLWYTDSEKNSYQGYYTNEKHIVNYNFLAPFIKLRYSVIEITYRGLLGYYEKWERDRMEGYYGGVGGWVDQWGNYHSENIYNGGYDYIRNYDDGFSYNNHQLMLGFYFGTNKRQRK